MATDTTLRPGEIKDILLREIEAADLHELDVEEVGTVLEVKDGIARIYGLQKAMAGEMLEIRSSETGNAVTALALNLEEDNIGAVILGDYLQLKEGDEVRRTSRVLEVPVGPTLVGRVVDALGRPIDGEGDINTSFTRKVESPAPGIIDGSLDSGGKPVAIDLYEHVTMALTGQWTPGPHDAPALHALAGALKDTPFWCSVVSGDFTHAIDRT